VALERTEGLPWLALDVADDVALGKLLKSSGARCAVAMGRGLLSVDWYPSLPAMVRGLEKNTFSVLGCSLPRAVAVSAVALLADVSPLLALLPFGLPWLTALGGLATLAALGTGAGIAVRSGRPLLPALLWPVGTLLFTFIVLRAGVLGHRRGGIRWRDTFYPSAVLRRGARVRFP
jgi:hypothetical protein